MNGDGNVDILHTSADAIAGVVALGDGNGNFPIADYFETSYEPTIAATGPVGGKWRDILALNVRSGSYTVFQQSGHYLPYRQGSLNFIPDCIAHLVELASGMDYLWTARAGSVQRLWRWDQDGSLTEGTLPLSGQPSVSINGDTQRDGSMATLQAYQVGGYASVVLSNVQGQAFNVVNLRMAPRIFVVIGDVFKAGSLDVGIAFLVSTDRAD